MGALDESSTLQAYVCSITLYVVDGTPCRGLCGAGLRIRMGRGTRAALATLGQNCFSF